MFSRPSLKILLTAVDRSCCEKKTCLLILPEIYKGCGSRTKRLINCWIIFFLHDIKQCTWTAVKLVVFNVLYYQDYQLSKSWALIVGSSRSQMFFKIRVAKNSANFTGKHQYWSLFLIKLQAWFTVIVFFRSSSL